MVGSDAPSDYHITPRTENPSSQQLPAAPTASPPPPPGLAPPSTAAGGFLEKKKRGRPRKYGPDGTVVALSPKPISSAPLPMPPVIDFSVGKRGKVRPVGLVSSKQQIHRLGVESLEASFSPGSRSGASEWVSCSVGANFTPHIITVNTGEDVMMKVISFSQQGPRAICILSANGVISSVTLRQSDSSGGTLTYEGRFEILSLTGSFTPSETGGIRNRSGGMSVSLASPDGRVMGGGVAGSLVAAGPIQIVVGSFLAANQHEQPNKKPKIHTIMAPTPANPIPISTTEIEDTYGGEAPHVITAPKPNLLSSLPFLGNSWSAIPTADSRDKLTDINESLSG